MEFRIKIPGLVSLLVDDSFVPEDTLNPVEHCAHDSLRINFHLDTMGVVNVLQTMPRFISHPFLGLFRWPSGLGCWTFTAGC